VVPELRGALWLSRAALEPISLVDESMFSVYAVPAEAALAEVA
jgi:hypothetical protein